MSRGEADAGDEVTVSWGGDEFKCKVVEVKVGAVKVHYVGWGAGHDEWVSTEGEDKPPLPKENEAGVENVTKEAKKPCFCKFAFIYDRMLYPLPPFSSHLIPAFYLPGNSKPTWRGILLPL